MEENFFNLSPLHHGQDLKEQWDSSSGELEIQEYEEVAAVYFWLKKISPPQHAIANQQNFSEWVEKSINKIDGTISGRVGHLGSVEVTLGDGSLEPDKLEAFVELGGSFQDRKVIQSLFGTMDHKLALYVGETGDLPVRIGQHLSGHTDFAKRMTKFNLSWEDLALQFVLLPENITTRQRRALERIFSIFLLAPATSRAG